MQQFEYGKFGVVHLPIHFKINHLHKMASIGFKVDTGADFTTISKVDLATLGYDLNWISNHITNETAVITASGDRLTAAVIPIPLLNILGYEAKSWPVTILLDTNKDFKNLLGRDLLAGFNYTFHNETKKFKIERTPKFDYLYEPTANQEIHNIDKL